MTVTRKTTNRTSDVTSNIDTSNMSKKACFDYLVDQIALFETRKELLDEAYTLDELRDMVAEEMEKEVAPPKAAPRSAPRATPAAAAPASSMNVDKMTRGECLNYLVGIGAYKTKAEARQAYPAVADLRDLVSEHIDSVGKGGTRTRRTAAPVAEPVQRRTRREEPVAEPVQRRTRREVAPVAEPVRRTRREVAPVAEPVRRTRREVAPALSPIVAFTADNVDDIIGDVNTSIDAFNASICAATGVDMLGASSVHATNVHEKCLFLTFAFGTTGMSPKALAKFLAEAVEADKIEAAYDDDDTNGEDDDESIVDEELIDDMIDIVVEATGLEEDKARKYVEAWFKNYDAKIEPSLGVDVEIGTELYNTDGELVTVVGYDVKTDRLVCFNAETEKLVRFTYKEISHCEFAEDIDGAEPEADAKPANPEEEFDDFE
jgi:hypothetical protein